MDKFGLEENVIEDIVNILEKYPEVEKHIKTLSKFIEKFDKKIM